MLIWKSTDVAIFQRATPGTVLTALGLVALTLSCSTAVDSKRAPSGVGAPSMGTPPGVGTDPAAKPGTQPGNGAPTTEPAVIPVPIGAVAGPTLLRRLTSEEYRKSVQSVFGLAAPPTEPLESNAWTNGFDNFASALTVSPTLASQYAAAAAARAAKDLTPPACQAPMPEFECATAFITSFGKNAFRRPLTQEEITAYVALYSDEHTRSGYAGGVRQVAETMLQAPQFVYRFELGNPAGGAMRTLTSYEVASALSFLFTAAPPDTALLTAADTNALQDKVAIEAQARRLMQLPAAQDAFRNFLIRFSGIAKVAGSAKDPTAYPEFTADTALALEGSTAAFFDSVLWQGDGTFATLMTAPYAFVDSALAPILGVTAPAQGSAFARAELNPAERAGLLTQPAVLSEHSKSNESFPIYRGKFVRVGLLCETLPSPPANVPAAPMVDATKTARERSAQHMSDPACSGCHQLIDPVGFTLENYDGIGRYRTMDNGKLVDASGSISGSVDMDGQYKNGVELATKLATSMSAKQCLALQAYRWTFARMDRDGERAAVAGITEPLAAAGLDIRELMVAITKSDNFMYRSFQ